MFRRRQNPAQSPRRAVLHVGTMKTGTSSIQKVLSDQGEPLAEAGWRYLGGPIRRPEALEAALAKAGPDESVIVVDEGWWHFGSTGRVHLAEMAELLKDYEITVVVYFRRPDQYVEAWFSQGLKNGKGAALLDTFLSHPFVNRPTERDPADGPYAGVNLRMLGRLNNLTRTFPDARLVLRPYERKVLANGDVVTDFLKLLDLDPRKFRSPGGTTKENVTPDASDLLLVSLLRKKYNVPEPTLREILALPRREGGGRLLTFDEASGINEAMKPNFRKVQAKYGGGVGSEFFADWSLDPATYRVSPMREAYDRELGARPDRP